MRKQSQNGMINCLSKCKKTQDLNLVRSSKIVMLKHYTVLPIKAKSDKIKKKKKEEESGEGEDKPHWRKYLQKKHLIKDCSSKHIKTLKTHQYSKNNNFLSGLKIWTDTLPKKTYRWQIGIWELFKTICQQGIANWNNNDMWLHTY